MFSWLTSWIWGERKEYIDITPKTTVIFQHCDLEVAVVLLSEEELLNCTRHRYFKYDDNVYDSKLLRTKNILVWCNNREIDAHNSDAAGDSEEDAGQSIILEGEVGAGDSPEYDADAKSLEAAEKSESDDTEEVEMRELPRPESRDEPEEEEEAGEAGETGETGDTGEKEEEEAGETGEQEDGEAGNTGEKEEEEDGETEGSEENEGSEGSEENEENEGSEETEGSEKTGKFAQKHVDEQKFIAYYLLQQGKHDMSVILLDYGKYEVREVEGKLHLGSEDHPVIINPNYWLEHIVNISLPSREINLYFG